MWLPVVVVTWLFRRESVELFVGVSLQPRSEPFESWAGESTI
jgi:hypothetical protein